MKTLRPLALSLFADLPTGDKESGISAGTTGLGAGLHYTAGQFTAGCSYTIVGDRSAKNSNFPFLSLQTEITETEHQQTNHKSE